MMFVDDLPGSGPPASPVAVPGACQEQRVAYQLVATLHVLRFDRPDELSVQTWNDDVGLQPLAHFLVNAPRDHCTDPRAAIQTGRPGSCEPARPHIRAGGPLPGSGDSRMNDD
ncbi:hypothetical protein GCM10009661_62230 [Catellatospora chokoriensis]|uniref:Uncharacterized protein n=1 Tax=Catellatospora chokoriensis TaxID=310353 RepID=A0A8J3K8A6_9ACTN|nr:hypothetical protein Cch02nite_37680 [Catellatospora chokoriensis]